MAAQVRKKHGSKRERAWKGPALFSLGFRPFFLFAALWAMLAMIWWLAVLGEGKVPAHILSPENWHRHEMLWGYGAAVVGGFLCTAIPNRSGRYPSAGWPLITIFILWLAGRMAMLLGGALPFGLVAGIEVIFLPVQTILIAREVLSAKNTHNNNILLSIFLIAVANICFYIDIWQGGNGDGPVRAGFAGFLMLLTLIGGRVIPSFTRNWLVQQGVRRLPHPVGKFDAGVAFISNVALLGWVAALPVAPLLAVAGVLHLVRLGRWAGARCWRNPLLAMLHVAYAGVGVGFLVLAAALWHRDAALQTAALHVFGIGVIAGLSIAVMMRASLSQTGRQLRAGYVLGVAAGLVFAALITRLAAIFWPDVSGMIMTSGLLWIAGFGLFCIHVGPWLLAARR